MASPEEPSIGTRTLRGTFWAYGSYVGGQMLVLVSMAILARVLTPADFGLVALAMVFFTLLETVSDLGLSASLVLSVEEELADRAQTVFFFAVGLGATLSLLTAAAAPAAAHLFDEPRLVSFLPLLGLLFLIRSLGATHYALAQRRIDFRSRTAAELANVLVRGPTAIVLALTGFGAWSLVAGYLAGAMAMTVTLWTRVHWRPAWRLSRAYLSDMLRFGRTLTGVDILAALISQVDYVLIGQVLGTTALGFYSLGFRLPELLITNLAVVAGRVLFPAFAAVDRGDLGRTFLLSLRYAAMVGLPLAAGLAVLAEPLVFALFGDQWGESVQPMRVLTLYALSMTLGIPAGTAYKATGQAKMLLKLGIPWAVLAVGSIVLFVDRGIGAVAACQAGAAGFSAVIGMVFASRLLHVGSGAVVRALWPPVVAAAAMGLVVAAVQHVVSGPWPTILAAVPAGAAAYGGLLWLLAPEMLRHLLAKALPSKVLGDAAS